MKKIAFCLVFVVFLSSLVFASGEKAKIGVMQGPTGFSSVALGDCAQVSVFPSPNEVVARLISGELDMAVLPANSVSVLYNKGVKIKALAVVGEGMLSLLGTDNSIKTVNVPGAGGTPDHMAKLLFEKYEEDISITAPAQLAQMLIAEKVKLAILPQPFVTMATMKNSNIKVFENVQERWAKVTGYSNYPMSVLVASEEFVKSNPISAKIICLAYKESIDWVLNNNEEAGKLIEQAGIMKAAMATPALKNCALVYKDGNEAKTEVMNYYSVLLKLEPSAIGNKLPDDNLWGI